MTVRLTFSEVHDNYCREIAAGELMNRGALEGALEAPFGGIGDTEFYPTLYEKAARLAYGICQAHAYQDGNKRLSWLSAVVFLAANGVVIEVDQDEAAHVILAVAAGECTPEQLTLWFVDCTSAALLPTTTRA